MQRVVVLEPGKTPEVREIAGFDGAQEIIGARSLQCLRMARLDYLYDEDGKSKGLRENREVNGTMILGTLVVTKLVPGDIASLTEGEASVVVRQLQGP